MISVKAIAVKTIGLGCIVGDTCNHIAQRIDDKGTYFEVVIHENRKVRYRKDAWKLTQHPV